MSLANKPEIKIEKMGHGRPDNKEDPVERFDAILNKNGTKTAISTLMPVENNRDMRLGFGEILQSLAEALESENISKLYIVLFESNKDEERVKYLEEAKKIIKENLSSRIIISPVKYCDVEKWSAEIEL